MKDYFVAAMYTALFIAIVAGIATAITAFPKVGVFVCGVFLVGLIFNVVLTTIRSQRTINELRARYE